MNMELYNKALDAFIARRGNGFRQEPSSRKRQGNRHRLPTLLERLADLNAGEDGETSYDPRPLSSRGNRKRAQMDRARRRMKAEQKLLAEYRQQPGVSAFARVRDMVRSETWAKRLEQARGLA